MQALLLSRFIIRNKKVKFVKIKSFSVDVDKGVKVTAIFYDEEGKKIDEEETNIPFYRKIKRVDEVDTQNENIELVYDGPNVIYVGDKEYEEIRKNYSDNLCSVIVHHGMLSSRTYKQFISSLYKLFIPDSIQFAVKG
jgi:hypothetical protein